MDKIKSIVFSNKIKTIILSTLIFMIIAHGFCYMNVLFSHDSIRTFFWTKADTIGIGRYLLPLLLIIRGKYYPPLLIGFLTYLFMVAIIILLVDLFSIKKKTSIILLSGIMTTACTLTLLNATYIDFSDMYVLALLLSTIGAYLWRNYKYGFIFAIIPVFLTLPIYQPYICFFTGIVILILIKDIIEKMKTKKIIIDSITALVTFVSSMLLYALSLKIVNALFHIELRSAYNSVNDIGSFTGLNQIISLFVGTYKQFFDYIMNPSTYYIVLISIFNIILIVIAICICIRKVLKCKDKIVRLVMFLLFTLLLPFALNFIYLLGKGVEHQLMIYSLFLLYVFVIMLAEITKMKKGAFSVLVMILLSITIFSNIIYSNKIYLVKDLNVKTTLTTVNRIIDRIEQIDGYEVGKTKVAFIGTLNSGSLFMPRKDIKIEDVGIYDNFGLTYYRTYQVFFENYLAYPINIISEEEVEAIKRKEEIANMPCYPNKESIQFVGDILIIKLSN